MSLQFVCINGVSYSQEFQNGLVNDKNIEGPNSGSIKASAGLSKEEPTKVERESTFERVNMTEKKIDDKIYSVNIIENSNIIGDDDNEPIYEDQYSGCDNSTRRRTSVARGKKVTNKSSSTTPGGKLSMKIMVDRAKVKGKKKPSGVDASGKNKDSIIVATNGSVSSSSISSSSDDSARIREFGKKVGFVWKDKGTNDKVEWVKKIGDGEKPCVVGLQETKLKEVDGIFVKRMWYDNNFGFAQVNLDGGSGAIITIWDSNIFIGNHVAGEEGFLAVVGKWKGLEGLVGLLNVYGPRDKYKRLELWNRLGNVLGMRDIVWCIFGDFNEVRGPEERMNS
ncbi:RNA-directed DNA polymerase, eukaryota [Tanacetum coccineum]